MTTLGCLLMFALASPSPSSPPSSSSPSTEATGPLDRHLTLLAFSDDGTRALVFERSGTAVLTEAVWIVDAGGVVEILPLGTRAPSAIMPRDDDEVCVSSAKRLSAMAKDYDLISVRIGMCHHPSRGVVKAMRTQGAEVVSAAIGALHQKVGFPGATFVARRGGLVVVIGTDIFGNDRLGTTTTAR